MNGRTMSLDRIRSIVITLLGVVLLAGVALNFVNVAMRYFFGSPFPWTEEAMTFGMILLVMAGTVVATAANANLKIDLILQIAPGRVASAFHIVSNLVWCGIAIYLAMQSRTVVELMMRFGQKSPAAGVPMWIPHSFVLVGFALCALAALAAVGREIWKLRHPETQPTP